MKVEKNDFADATRKIDTWLIHYIPLLGSKAPKTILFGEHDNLLLEELELVPYVAELYHVAAMSSVLVNETACLNSLKLKEGFEHMTQQGSELQERSNEAARIAVLKSHNDSELVKTCSRLDDEDEASIFDCATQLTFDWQTILILAILLILFICGIMKLVTFVAFCGECIFGHRSNAIDDEQKPQKRMNVNANVIDKTHISKAECKQSELECIIEAMGALKFSEGKQRGRSFKEVHEFDKAYVKWVVSHEHSLSFGYRIFMMYIQLRSHMT